MLATIKSKGWVAKEEEYGQRSYFCPACVKKFKMSRF